MNQPNPYAPPAAAVADVGAPLDPIIRLRTPRYLLGAFVLLQLLATLLYAAAYFELTRTGAVSAIALLGLVLGSLCLYAGTLVVVLGRPRGTLLFALAAFFLGSSLRGWGLTYVWSWVIGYGTFLAVLGVLLARAMRPR